MLIIDEFTKTIFLHNPKCGGTFVKKSYQKHYPAYPELLYKVRVGYFKEANVYGAHIDINNLPRFLPDYKE